MWAHGDRAAVSEDDRPQQVGRRCPTESGEGREQGQSWPAKCDGSHLTVRRRHQGGRGSPRLVDIFQINHFSYRHPSAKRLTKTQAVYSEREVKLDGGSEQCYIDEGPDIQRQHFGFFFNP